MGQQFRDSTPISPNQRTGFSLKKRGKYYQVRFKSPSSPPEGPHEYITQTTGETTPEEARQVAIGLIEAAYHVRVKTVPWETAIQHLEARIKVLGKSPKTLEDYLGALKQFRVQFPDVAGPADVTVEMATEFRDAYAIGTYQRGEGEARERSLFTLATRLKSLRSLWGKWFCDQLHICPSNPFEKVGGPDLPKITVVVPSDEEFDAFFHWLEDRFDGWRLPILFFEVKEHAVTRLLDLCSIKTDQLKNGQLFFNAAIVKGKKDRGVPLPEDMFKELQNLAGPVYLWENYQVELKAILDKKGWPTHRMKDGFDPKRFYAWIEGLTVRYRQETGKTIKTHSFRKRAFTKFYKMKVDPRDAAIAGGCNTQTMMKHYVEMDEAAICNEVYAQILSQSTTPNERPCNTRLSHHRMFCNRSQSTTPNERPCNEAPGIEKTGTNIKIDALLTA